VELFASSSSFEAGVIKMTKVTRVVTANLPNGLALRLDEVAADLDRSRSWIIRQALADWFAYRSTPASPPAGMTRFGSDADPRE
jgi:hypothetical protein